MKRQLFLMIALCGVLANIAFAQRVRTHVLGQQLSPKQVTVRVVSNIQGDSNLPKVWVQNFLGERATVITDRNADAHFELIINYGSSNFVPPNYKGRNPNKEGLAGLWSGAIIGATQVGAQAANKMGRIVGPAIAGGIYAYGNARNQVDQRKILESYKDVGDDQTAYSVCFRDLRGSNRVAPCVESETLYTLVGIAYDGNSREYKYAAAKIGNLKEQMMLLRVPYHLGQTNNWQPPTELRQQLVLFALMQDSLEKEPALRGSEQLKLLFGSVNPDSVVEGGARVTSEGNRRPELKNGFGEVASKHGDGKDRSRKDDRAAAEETSRQSAPANVSSTSSRECQINAGLKNENQTMRDMLAEKDRELSAANEQIARLEAEIKAFKANARPTPTPTPVPMPGPASISTFKGFPAEVLPGDTTEVGSRLVGAVCAGLGTPLFKEQWQAGVWKINVGKNTTAGILEYQKRLKESNPEVFNKYGMALDGKFAGGTRNYFQAMWERFPERFPRMEDLLVKSKTPCLVQ